MVVKIYIVSYVESINPAAVRNFPAFGNARNYFQTIVQLYKPVKNLIHSPDVFNGFGRSRIQRSNSPGFVITEYFFLCCFVFGRTAGRKQKANKPRPEKVFYHWVHFRKSKFKKQN